MAVKLSQLNGGGKDPKGEANGIPTKNPASHEPADHNKGTAVRQMIKGA